MLAHAPRCCSGRTALTALAACLLLGALLWSDIMATGTSSPPDISLWLATRAPKHSRSADDQNITSTASLDFLHRGSSPFSSLAEDLRTIEAVEPFKTLAERFNFQDRIRQTLNPAQGTRPHSTSDIETVVSRFPTPVPEYCPSRWRPDHFCTPNLGRDWGAQSIVFPLSYALPEALFVKRLPARRDKLRDSARILPRDRSSMRFDTEEAYRAELHSSYFCMTYKKGGWDALRHYEVIAAGCMPFMPDIDYAPIYTMYHFPKQLVLGP